ncbi:MAG: hypothetical protein H7145_13460 [Akkermansiaceae bacterium]|nr:hypothetical protein [Armatimonadota bacterium]
MREILLTAAALWLVSQNGNAQGKGKPKGPAPTPKLTTKEFPDGTGLIGLAPGWVLDGAYRGTCGCKSANGSSIMMGRGQAILRPDGPVGQMPEAAMLKMPAAQVGDLGGAIRSILEGGGSRVKSLRSRPAPPISPGVPAFYYLYEYEKQGKRLTALGYFTTIAYYDSSSNWDLYSSYVTAPSERFVTDLPVMMAMWNSWRPNGSKPKAGSESAMIDEVLKENLKTHAATMKEQRESFERMQEKFKNALLQ